MILYFHSAAHSFHMILVLYMFLLLYFNLLGSYGLSNARVLNGALFCIFVCVLVKLAPVKCEFTVWVMHIWLLFRVLQ